MEGEAQPRQGLASDDLRAPVVALVVHELRVESGAACLGGRDRARGAAWDVLGLAARWNYDGDSRALKGGPAATFLGTGDGHGHPIVREARATWRPVSGAGTPMCASAPTRAPASPCAAQRSQYNRLTVHVIACFGLLAVAAAGGYGLLRRLGCDPFEAWSMGRIVGLVGAVLPAWWWASCGGAGWPAVAMTSAVALAVPGLVALKRDVRGVRGLLGAEAVFWAGFFCVAALRLGHPEIIGTEKPMDLGILASLLRCESFPPPDVWLSRHTLNYYYFGSVPWAALLRLGGLGLDIGYNLVVALQGGVVFVGAWALGRRVAGGSHRGGALAAVLVAFAGTPDGLRQLFAGTTLANLDLWGSSRQVAHAITEFPMFTLWLGDLHAHLLSLPIAMAAVTIALVTARSDPGWQRAGVLGGLLAAAWMANPWCLLPTAAATVLGLTVADGGWGQPGGSQRPWWSTVVLMALAAFALSLPFHIAFRAPFAGIGFARAVTRPAELLLYCGPWITVALAVAVVHLSGSLFAGRRHGALWIVAGVVLLAAISLRPTFVLLLFALAVLTHRLARGGRDPVRPAIALAVVGLLLFLVPELLYVRDSYGPELHRMNTVFKAYFQGWVFLAVALPALLAELLPPGWARRAGIAGLIVLGAAHPIGAVARVVRGGNVGTDGLRWMEAGDRHLVATLRALPVGVTMLEAVGRPYSQFGRLSAASGVPTLLGWANHQRVWRGRTINDELIRRKKRVEQIYGCGDPSEIVEVAREEGVDVIAVGSLERQQYSPEALAAVERAGAVLARSDEALLVAVSGGRTATNSEEAH